MKPLFLMAAAVCLLAPGCDSKNPLSDPQTSKADERLVGQWLHRGADEDDYYLARPAGEKFPACMLRVVGTKHTKGTVQPGGEFLAFPTTLGDKTYLNVVVLGNDAARMKKVNEEGWKAVEAERYMFYKYAFDGDKLVLYGIDGEAKQKAIKSGKVKGTVKDNSALFTDTTENVARFVAETGDSLWNMKQPGQLERVKK